MITGLDQVPPDLLVFHAGTGQSGSGSLVTAGGRVLGITALGDTIAEAVGRAYQGVELYFLRGDALPERYRPQCFISEAAESE